MQSAAVVSAEASYLQSLTEDPKFSSVISNLVTNTAALGAVGAFATFAPTGTDAVAAASSLIKELPSDVAPYFSSALNEQIAIFSSIVNNGAASGKSDGSSSSARVVGTSTGSGSSGSSATSAAGSAGAQTQSGSGAAPTNVVKVGGAAIAMLGAAVAML